MMNEEVKKFIEDNIELIENNEWEEVYRKDFPHGFTETLLDCDINPLELGLNYIPDDFLYDSNIKEFIIPNNVESIGEYAFYKCHKLKKIQIPNSVTSIGKDAFYNCNKLTSIEIPNSVISIGDRAFYACSKLTNIEIPDSVKSIDIGAFSGCLSLTSIAISNNVTSIKHSAFYNCKSLTSIIIPDSVTIMGNYAFSRCSNLTSIKYNGTKEEWNNINRGKGWRDGSAISKIICTDGEIEL